MSDHFQVEIWVKMLLIHKIMPREGREYRSGKTPLAITLDNKMTNDTVNGRAGEPGGQFVVQKDS